MTFVADRRGDALAGAVLVGGSSRRMGHDKATLVVDGMPLAQRVAKALADAGAAPVVGVGRTEGPAGGPIERWLPDDHPGQGPLGGIVTALGSTTGDWVAILSCDLPRADPAEIRRLVDTARRSGADVTVTVRDGRDEPLHAIWHRRCAPVLAAAFGAGARAPRAVFDALTVARVPAVDPASVDDVDSPADLVAVGAGAALAIGEQPWTTTT